MAEGTVLDAAQQRQAVSFLFACIHCKPIKVASNRHVLYTLLRAGRLTKAWVLKDMHDYGPDGEQPLLGSIAAQGAVHTPARLADQHQRPGDDPPAHPKAS